MLDNFAKGRTTLHASRLSEAMVWYNVDDAQTDRNSFTVA